MNVLAWGDKPAPVMIEVTLRSAAKKRECENPRAAQAIKDKSYMNDILVSAATEEVTELTKKIYRILEKGGFQEKAGMAVQRKISPREQRERRKRSWCSSRKAKILGLYDGSYLCSNDIFLGRASSQISQAVWRNKKSKSRVRTEDRGVILETMDERRIPVAFSKEKLERRKTKRANWWHVIVADGNVVRGKWMSDTE